MKAVFLTAAVGFAAGILGAGEAEARPAECSLVIAQRDVFSGTCNFSSESDGSFILTSPTGYFVYVTIHDTPGEAVGYWNGWTKENRAHDDLGTLTREAADRACWSNGYARVCAR